MCDKLALQYFEYDTEEARVAAPSQTCKVKCLSCSNEIKYDGSTGNLIKHLRTNPLIHSAALQHYFEQKKERAPPHRKRKYDYNYLQHADSLYYQSQVATPQQDFSSYLYKFDFQQQQQSQQQQLDRKPIDDALCQWILSESCVTTSLLDSESFKRFLSSLNTDYQPLTRMEFIKSYLPNTYSSIKMKIKNLLSKCSSVNVICDIWSSNDSGRQIIISFSAQSIDKSWSFMKLVLKCSRLNIYSKNGNLSEIIYKKFNECITEYEIENKIFKITTDDGTGLLKALKELKQNSMNDLNESSIDELLNDIQTDDSDEDSEDDEEENQNEITVDCVGDSMLEMCDDDTSSQISDNDDIVDPGKQVESYANMDFGVERYICAAQTIQKIINETIGFNEFKVIFQKCRIIFRKARSLPSCRAKIQNFKKTSKNSTQFNSMYILVKCVLSLSNKEFEEILSCKSVCRFTMLERGKLKEICELLEDLYICINHMTSSDAGCCVTISKILPAIRTVKHHLQNQSFKYFDKIRLELLKRIEASFDYLENDFSFGIASMLDPNYGLSWCPPNERKLWFDRLKALATLEADKGDEQQSDIQDNDSTTNTSTSTTSSASNKPKWFITFQDDYENDYDKIEKCLNTFLLKSKNFKLNNTLHATTTAIVHHDECSSYIDPLKFWKDYENEFPILARIVRRLFSIPASSTSVQKSFKLNDLNKLRKKVDYDPCKIFFIRSNKDLI